MKQINCTSFQFPGKCFHQAAPRRLFGIAGCILITENPDPRVIVGCALKTERKPPPKVIKK